MKTKNHSNFTTKSWHDLQCKKHTQLLLVQIINENLEEFRKRMLWRPDTEEHYRPRETISANFTTLIFQSEEDHHNCNFLFFSQRHEITVPHFRFFLSHQFSFVLSNVLLRSPSDLVSFKKMPLCSLVLSFSVLPPRRGIRCYLSAPCLLQLQFFHHEHKVTINASETSWYKHETKIIKHELLLTTFLLSPVHWNNVFGTFCVYVCSSMLFSSDIRSLLTMQSQPLHPSLTNDHSIIPRIYWAKRNHSCISPNLGLDFTILAEWSSLCCFHSWHLPQDILTTNLAEFKSFWYYIYSLHRSCSSRWYRPRREKCCDRH